MTRKCLNCGEDLLEDAHYCPKCGTLTGGIDSIKGIIKDIQKSQVPLKTVDEIKTIINNPENRLKTNPKMIKKWALRLMLIDFIAFILILNLAVRQFIPLIIAQIFSPFWFLSMISLSCIWFSFSTFKENEVSSGVNAMIFKDYEKAIEKFIKALRRNPEELNAWRGLGYLYSSAKEYKDAVEACKQGLETKPNDKILWWILASTCQQNKDIERSKEAWQKLRDLGLGEEISVEIKGGYPYFRVKKSGLKPYNEILK